MLRSSFLKECGKVNIPILTRVIKKSILRSAASIKNAPAIQVEGEMEQSTGARSFCGSETPGFRIETKRIRTHRSCHPFLRTCPQVTPYMSEQESVHDSLKRISGFTLFPGSCALLKSTFLTKSDPNLEEMFSPHGAQLPPVRTYPSANLFVRARTGARPQLCPLESIAPGTGTRGLFAPRPLRPLAGARVCRCAKHGCGGSRWLGQLGRLGSVREDHRRMPIWEVLKNVKLGL